MMMLRFWHFLGVALWLGGAVAAMVVSRAARTDINGRFFFALLARIHGLVVAPGALLTVVTGLLLTMSLVNRGATDLMASPGMIVMQGAGLVAAMLALFVGLPTANQLAGLALAEGVSPKTERLKKRQVIVSLIAAVLAFASLYFGVVVR